MKSRKLHTNQTVPEVNYHCEMHHAGTIQLSLGAVKLYSHYM